MRFKSDVSDFIAKRLTFAPEVQRAVEAIRDFARQFVPVPDSVAVAGTGAALEVADLGSDDFVAIAVINRTAPGLYLHFKGMPAGSAFSIKDNGAGGTATAYAAADGITLGKDADGNIKSGSFVLGTGIHAADDNLHVFALGI